MNDRTDTQGYKMLSEFPCDVVSLMQYLI